MLTREKEMGEKERERERNRDSHVLRQVPDEVLVLRIVSLLGVSKGVAVGEIEYSFRL